MRVPCAALGAAGTSWRWRCPSLSTQTGWTLGFMEAQGVKHSKQRSHLVADDVPGVWHKRAPLLGKRPVAHSGASVPACDCASQVCTLHAHPGFASVAWLIQKASTHLLQGRSSACVEDTEVALEDVCAFDALHLRHQRRCINVLHGQTASQHLHSGRMRAGGRSHAP